MGTPLIKSIKKYTDYSMAYLQHGDIESLIDSFRFMVMKKGALRNRVVKSHFGKVKSRKGTNDFQFANYYYEWGVKSFILNVYKDFDVFFDLGSGIGDYSLLLAQKGLRCFAFEPIKGNYKILEENIRLNQHQNLIHAFNLGIGAKKEETEFIKKAINTGASHRANLKVNKHIQNESIELVKIETLDYLLPSFNLCKTDKILVKMDIEGMETEALNGARNFIQYFPEIMLILEAKHSWDKKIIESLYSLANFDIGQVDELNIYAKKINSH